MTSPETKNGSGAKLHEAEEEEEEEKKKVDNKRRNQKASCSSNIIGYAKKKTTEFQSRSQGVTGRPGVYQVIREPGMSQFRTSAYSYKSVGTFSCPQTVLRKARERVSNTR